MRPILIPVGKIDWELVYFSPVMCLGPLHVAVTSFSVDTLNCSVEEHVRVKVYSASIQRSIATKRNVYFR